MSLTDRGMAAALRALRRLARTRLADRPAVRDRLSRALYRGTRTGLSTAGSVGRFVAAARQRRSTPARPARTTPPDRFDLTPTEEQALLVGSLGELAEQRLRPAAADADAKRAAPDDVLAHGRDMGLVGLGVPAELGGIVEERSAVTGVLAAEALGAGDMGLAAAGLAPGAVATALGLWGDAAQQETYLPPFAGEDPPVAALALAEPHPLADPLRPAARARRDGGDLVLDGVKSLVPGGQAAELLLVGCRLEGAGPALVLVEPGPGVRAEPEPALGVRAAATARVTFEGARTPAGAVLGGAGAGGPQAVCAAAVHRARLAWAALAVGTSQAVLDYVIPYVNAREAFGEPISHRQGVAFAVADLAVELEGLRLAVRRAAARADQGRPFAREAALARQLAADKAAAIGSDGVQLLGGHGYVREHPVERWYRDLRTAGVIEGGLLV